MAVISSTASATTTASLDLVTVWLVDPQDPSLDTSLRVRDWAERQQPAEQGVFDPIGGGPAIVVDGGHQGVRDGLVAKLADRDARGAVEALLDPPRTLLLQIPADVAGGEGEQLWVRPTYPTYLSRVNRRVRSPARWFVLSFVEVDEPVVV